MRDKIEENPLFLGFLYAILRKTLYERTSELKYKLRQIKIRVFICNRKTG